MADTAVREPRSKRARGRFEGETLRTIDQIPTFPGIPHGAEGTGAWAYYLREDGETIGEILIISPNGGIPDIPDRRMAARYGANAAEFRARYAEWGMKYLGSKLTEEVMDQVVDVLERNRPEAILFCQDEIADCEDVISNSDRPDVRDQAKRRRAAFNKRLAYLEQPFDKRSILMELRDIARAYQLSQIDPTLLNVIKSMMGDAFEDQNNRIASMATEFKERQTGDSPLQRAKGKRGMPDPGSVVDFDAGAAGFIDSD